MIRYTSRLLLASSLPQHAPELGAQLKVLEGSLGTTRKALKLGKFLGGVKKLRSITPWTPHAALELVAGIGDTAYLFMEQLQWWDSRGRTGNMAVPGASCRSSHPDVPQCLLLPQQSNSPQSENGLMPVLLPVRPAAAPEQSAPLSPPSKPLRMIKVGLLSKSHADSLSYISAWFELVGYCGSITLATLQQQESLELELRMLDDLGRSRQLDEKWTAQDEGKVQAQLSKLRAGRTLRTLSILQDAAGVCWERAGGWGETRSRVWDAVFVHRRLSIPESPCALPSVLCPALLGLCHRRFVLGTGRYPEEWEAAAESSVAGCSGPPVCHHLWVHQVAQGKDMREPGH